MKRRGFLAAVAGFLAVPTAIAAKITIPTITPWKTIEPMVIPEGLCAELVPLYAQLRHMLPKWEIFIDKRIGFGWDAYQIILKKPIRGESWSMSQTYDLGTIKKNSVQQSCAMQFQMMARRAERRA